MTGNLTVMQKSSLTVKSSRQFRIIYNRFASIQGFNKRSAAFRKFWNKSIAQCLVVSRVMLDNLSSSSAATEDASVERWKVIKIFFGIWFQFNNINILCEVHRYLWNLIKIDFIIFLGFDQLINLILDDTHERIFSTSSGMEQISLGLKIIRGDNVSVIGLVDEAVEQSVDFSKVRGEPLNPVVH